MLFPKEIFDLILKKDRYYYNQKLYEFMSKKIKVPELDELGNECRYLKKVNGFYLANVFVNGDHGQSHSMIFQNKKSKQMKMHHYFYDSTIFQNPF